jgi:hypothetical protein
MYVIREVLHCKPGKVRQMAEKFKEISAVLKKMGQEPMIGNMPLPSSNFRCTAPV